MSASADVQQAVLPVGIPGVNICSRCGRSWVGIARGAEADLAALMALDPDQRTAFAKCWTKVCVTQGGGR